MAEIYKFPTKPTLAIPCLICGDPVVITDEEIEVLRSGREIHSKICNECRRAILIARKAIKDKDTELYADNEDVSNFFDNKEAPQ